MAITGNMMNRPLLVSSILTHAVNNNPRQVIATAMGGGVVHRYTYAEFGQRARQLAVRLLRQGVGAGDRVATLAWNTYRHLEIYYATTGVGMVCHTVNPRLYFEQVAFIINDARDIVVFYDRQFAELVERLRPECPSVKQWVLLDEPEDAAPGDMSVYGNWLGADDTGFEWPQFDENTACGLCYTSGTTGNPKGALYSHRSTLLHAYASCHPDALGLSRRDAVMPLVPMYHVNAWGLPYSGLLSGVKFVMPGADMSGPALHALCESEGVTLSAGVPSIWHIILDHVEAKGLGFSTLRRVVIGGSACPPAMVAALAQIGVTVRHAWGMTEMSPLGTMCFLLPEHDSLPENQKLNVLAAQGRPLFGVELRLIADGEVQPHDGKSSGDLMVRGNWVIERYYGQSKTALSDGWFHTGDVASIDREGYMRISDRSKDAVKSGGEWISSIEIENIAVEHPDVAMAACVAKPHPKWGERPVLVVVKKESTSPAAEDILSLYTDRVAKWMIPDEVIFIDDMPVTATGKIQKAALRAELFASRK